MIGRDMRLEGVFIVIDLVEKKGRLIAWSLRDIEHLTARLIINGRLGIDGDGVFKVGDMRGFGFKKNDNDKRNVDLRVGVSFG